MADAHLAVHGGAHLKECACLGAALQGPTWTKHMRYESSGHTGCLRQRCDSWLAIDSVLENRAEDGQLLRIWRNADSLHSC